MEAVEGCGSELTMGRFQLLFQPDEYCPSHKNILSVTLSWQLYNMISLAQQLPLLVNIAVSMFQFLPTALLVIARRISITITASVPIIE